MDVRRSADGLTPCPAGHLHAPAHGSHGLKTKQIGAEEPVADQVDRTPVLTYGVHVVAGVLTGDADQARAAPQSAAQVIKGRDNMYLPTSHAFLTDRKFADGLDRADGQ